MLKIVCENNIQDHIGTASPIQEGFLIKIFNSEDQFILKYIPNKNVYHSYIKLDQNLYSFFGKAEKVNSKRYRVRLSLRDDRSALIDFENLPQGELVDSMLTA